MHAINHCGVDIKQGADLSIHIHEEPDMNPALAIYT